MNATYPSTFQEMVLDLKHVFGSYSRLAVEIQLYGASYTEDAIKRIASGARYEPRYTSGNAIVQLHMKHCRTTLPSE